jgi:hypothetical protein
MAPPGIALMDFVTDLWGFQIAFALAELEIVDCLKDRARNSDDIAKEKNLSSDYLYRLMRSATNIDLLRENESKSFELTRLGRALCRGDVSSFRDFIIFMGRHGWDFWKHLTDCVREGKNAVELRTGKQPFEHIFGNPEVAVSFNEGMTAVTNMTSEAIVCAYDFSSFQKIVDVGGGHGRLPNSTQMCSQALSMLGGNKWFLNTTMPNKSKDSRRRQCMKCG